DGIRDRNVTGVQTCALPIYGSEVWKLIKETGVLDLNSSYSYLMWCSYFNDTSIIIESNEKVVGFVSGFVKPSSPNRLFIWQVARSEERRVGKEYRCRWEWVR